MTLEVRNVSKRFPGATAVDNVSFEARAGEITGYKHSLEYHPFAAKWFYGVYALCVVGSATAVGLVSDLVWLNIAAQVLNAFLLPLVIGLLVALAVNALPETMRLKGGYLWILIAVCTVVVAIGVFGGVQGVFAW